MYRLPNTLSIVLALGVNSFVVAQAPELEVTFLEQTPSTPQVAAQDPKPVFSLLQESPSTPQADVLDSKPTFSLLQEKQPADDAIAPAPKLEYTFLEDMRPTGFALVPKLRPEFEVGIKPIDFDQIFAALPVDKSLVAQPAPAETIAAVSTATSPVAVDTVPQRLAPVARIRVPVTTVTQRPSLAPAVSLAAEPLAEPAAAPKVAVTSPAVGTEVQPTAAVEGIIGGETLVEEVVLSSDGALLQPVAVEGSDVTPITSCDSCNNSMPCNCQSKGRKWDCFTGWWRNTHLYRKHTRHIGHPGMFCERPFGVCNEGWEHAMIAAGKVDRAMLHDYDFAQDTDGSISLTQRGQRELARIAAVMIEFPVPLSIESTLDPGQDTARKNAVVDAIATLGLPIAPDSIRVSVDRSIGLSGLDAQAIHAIRINEVLSGASRTRMYSDSAGAAVIPFLSGEGLIE